MLRRIIPPLMLTTLVVGCQQIELDSIPNAIPETEESDSEVSIVKYDGKSHIILLADTIECEGKIKATYLSWYEWENVMSSFSASTKAKEIERTYTEGGVSGWRIPSLNDVRRLKERYDDSEELLALNDKIETMGSIAILTLTDDGRNRRYLCANADSTFCLRHSAATIKAGATVKYNLRLIKDTVITYEPFKTNDTISFTF